MVNSSIFSKLINISVMQPSKMKKAMVMLVSVLDTGKDPVSGELNLEETANGIKFDSGLKIP